jgi:hypothetical protein
VATNQRIRGADVALAITVANALQNTLTAIDNFGATFKFEKIVQRYLGEQTVRTDEIFAGVEGKMKLHLYDEAFGQFVLALENRARRLTPTTVFNHVAQMNFPNGEQPVLSFPDVNYGDVPLEMTNAKDYVSLDLDFVCSEFDIQF